ncbi:MAG: hypothetical protein AB7G93_10485 [Bdellovibrionales bacterium]
MKILIAVSSLLFSVSAFGAEIAGRFIVVNEVIACGEFDTLRNDFCLLEVTDITGESRTAWVPLPAPRFTAGDELEVALAYGCDEYDEVQQYACLYEIQAPNKQMAYIYIVD